MRMHRLLKKLRFVKNCSKDELMPIIQGKILEGSTVHTDGWKAYDGLVLNGYDHYRVFHSHKEYQYKLMWVLQEEKLM